MTIVWLRFMATSLRLIKQMKPRKCIPNAMNEFTKEQWHFVSYDLDSTNGKITQNESDQTECRKTVDTLTENIEKYSMIDEGDIQVTEFFLTCNSIAFDFCHILQTRCPI